jgi:hypothetical protein
MTHSPSTFRAASASVILLSALALTSCREKLDDFNSEVACTDYCDKKYACDDNEPTDTEHDDCVSVCRSTIENECGNEHQQEANEAIQECVDMSCDDFWACMVFDVAPECFDFVD